MHGPSVLIGFNCITVHTDLQFQTLRFGIALAVAVWVLIFFVPLVPYRTQVVCSSFSCPLSVGGLYTGYNSLGLLFLHWGARLDTSFGEYIPPVISIVRGEQLTAFGAWIFILFPITLLVAALLFPEEWRLVSAGLSRLQRWREK